MVVLLEPICSAWIHEDANAGFLQLVKQNCEDEIAFIAEKKHIQCIKKIYLDNDIEFISIKNPVEKSDSDDYIHFLYYFGLLKTVIWNYKPDRLFILCAYRPCILAAELAAIIYRKLEINIILHGMVEVCKGHHGSYRTLFHFSKFCNRLRFITFSPYCTGAYWDVNENKFIFLHLNYLEYKLHRKDKQKQIKKVIGIIGACANDNAKKIIQYMNQHDLDANYEFWVASKYGKKFKNLNNVKVLELEFNRRKKMELLQQVDYLLLPYGQDEYALSASGVLWDAIMGQIPCFMLGSHYFKYYMQFKVGYQADNIKDLCKIMMEKIECTEDEKQDLFIGLDKLELQKRMAMKLLLSK